MNKPVRTWILVACALVVLGSLAAFAATGMHAWTRFSSEETAEVNAHNELDALFSDTGLNESHGEVGKIENRFAFGLLPSGPGLAMVSVATLSGAAFVVAVAAWWIARRRADA